MGQTVSHPADCSIGCYLWTLPCRTEQDLIERSRAKNNRQGTAGVLPLSAAGWVLFSVLFFFFLFFFAFPLFLDRLRPWWLKGRSWPWASSWVSSEARHWRIWSQLPVSIRMCKHLFLSFQCNARAALLSMHLIFLFFFLMQFCVKTPDPLVLSANISWKFSSQFEPLSSFVNVYES